jgi:hypothetical protein
MGVGGNAFRLFGHTAQASVWKYRGSQDKRSSTSNRRERNLLRLIDRKEHRVNNFKGVPTTYSPSVAYRKMLINDFLMAVLV